MNIAPEEMPRELARLEDENEELQQRINKATKTLKDTSVDMPSTLLMETIGYAIHILKGSDKE